MAVKAGFGNALGWNPGIASYMADTFNLDSLSSRTRVTAEAACCFLGEIGPVCTDNISMAQIVF